MSQHLRRLQTERNIADAAASGFLCCNARRTSNASDTGFSHASLPRVRLPLDAGFSPRECRLFLVTLVRVL